MKLRTSRLFLLSRFLRLNFVFKQAAALAMPMEVTTVTTAPTAPEHAPAAAASCVGCPGVNIPVEWRHLSLFEITLLVHPKCDSSRPPMGMPHSCVIDMNVLSEELIPCFPNCRRMCARFQYLSRLSMPWCSSRPQLTVSAVHQSSRGIVEPRQNHLAIRRASKCLMIISCICAIC